MMAPKIRFRVLPIIPLIASLCLHAQAQTSADAVFQLGPVPASLEASVITSYTIVDVVGETGVVTYSAACPSAISPENDACRDLSIYPVEVYHTQGSVWGGTITARAESRTTTWVCSLGSCGNCTPRMEARCRETIVEGGSTITTSRNITDACSVMYGSVPLVITAGVEKLLSYSYKGQLTNAAQYASAFNQELVSLGCPTRQALSPNTASTTTSSPATRTSPPLSSSPTTTQPQSVISTATNTSTGILPTSSKSSGSRNFGGPSWILAGFSLILLQRRSA